MGARPAPSPRKNSNTAKNAQLWKDGRRVSRRPTRVLRNKIFGPTQKTNGEWRQKTNEELEKLINHENIVRHIKSERLSWVGHVERMPDERVVKSIYRMETTRNKTERKAKIKMG